MRSPGSQSYQYREIKMGVVSSLAVIVGALVIIISLAVLFFERQSNADQHEATLYKYTDIDGKMDITSIPTQRCQSSFA